MFRDPSDLKTLDEFLDAEGIRDDVDERASRDVAVAQNVLPKPRARQIRPPVEAAIQLIVTRGATIRDAASDVGMKPKSLAIALRKPWIADRITAVRHEWFTSKTFEAWVGMADLAANAVSEDVRHKSLKVFIERAGELLPPTTRAPGNQQLVQIVMQGGGDRNEITITSPNASGVFEAEPFQPIRRVPGVSGND